MGKITITNQHDWMRYIATFPNGKITAVFSRNGANFKIDPPNRDLSKRLDAIDLNFTKKIKVESVWNYGKMFEVVEAVGKESKTSEEFVAALVKGLGVQDTVEIKASGPSETRVSSKSSRGGFLIDAEFPSGEKVELKINKSSVGWRMNPDMVSIGNDVMKFVFSLKGMEIMSDEEIAEQFVSAAKESYEVSEWVDNVKAAIFPSRKP